MNNLMEYRGYSSKIEYSDEDEVFHGKIIDINGLVSFEGTTVEELKKEFRDAVDRHIEFCEKNNKEPKKQYKGNFNVRIEPNLHKEAIMLAKSLAMSLNQFVASAIKDKIEVTKSQK